MGSFSTPITSFNAGEIAPTLVGRVDIQKYQQAVALCENWIVMPEGGVMRRPGTRFVSETANSDKATRLIPFIFSTEQAYVAELSENLIRFYTNEGILLDGGSPVTVVTTYAESELFDIQFTQSADVLYLVHPAHAPAKLQRLSATSWLLEDIAFFDGPYLEINPTISETTATTLTTSVGTPNVGATVTITASAVTGINDDAGFLATDVGRLIRLRHNVSPKKWGHVEITAYTNPTVVTGIVRQRWNDPSAHTVAKEWRLGAWYEGNYPATVAFFEQRLAFAGEPETPQTLHASRSGDFENFAPTGDAIDPDDPADNTVNDDNGLDFTISSNQVNAIEWLATQRNLIMGTPGGVYPVQASSNNEAVTPTNINVPQATVDGVLGIQPILVNNRICYVGRNSVRLKSLGFSFESDNYVANDLTLLADHIFGDGAVVQMDYQQEPESIIWVVRADGKLAACTYVPEQEVFAWHRHVIGGSFGAGDAQVESIAVIPAPNEDHDQLWLVVKRTIDGMTKRYVEFMEDFWKESQGIEEAFYLDSGLSGAVTAGVPASVSHLPGETVGVLADGAVLPDKVVSASGTVTLAKTYSRVHVGYGYRSDLESVDLAVPDAEGTSFGKQSRIDHLVVRFHETVGLRAGRDGSNLDPVIFRLPGDPMDTATPPFTGIKRLNMNDQFTRERRYYLRSDQPLPATILMLVATGEVGDR